MRKHLFKARRVDNMEWIYGSHLLHLQDHYIFPWVAWKSGCLIGFTGSANGRYPDREDNVEIDPKTLSEYIGIKDRNGNRIFENDLFVPLNEIPNPKQTPYAVKYTTEWSMFCGENIETDKYYLFHEQSEVEVIGSIFDSYSEGSV